MSIVTDNFWPAARGAAKIFPDLLLGYGDDVAEEANHWPDAGYALLDELSIARGRFALIADGTRAADRVVERFAHDIGVTIVSLGQAVTKSTRRPTANEIDMACDSAVVLRDIDLLFWPALHIPVLPFLAKRSRHQPTIAVWPGEIADRRATYSALGRPDYYDAVLRDVIVLRPRTTRFPDEVPFDIERIPR